MAFYISRFKNRESIEFDVEVVTPMFLGGAEKSNAELRVPSIKGMLRFWWRAMCGIDDLNTMRKEEANIFGSTEGKASFGLSISNSEKVKYQLEMKDRGKSFQVHGHNLKIVDYLAYGTFQYEKGKGNVYKKAHIAPGSSFSLAFTFFDRSSKKHVLAAFSYLISYGGLGSRARNGFGSLSTKISHNSLADSHPLSDFSAMSLKSKLFMFPPAKTWSDALSDIGLAYRAARLSVDHSHSYDKRKLIAAPITVGKKNFADVERHAKPYFLHVNKLDNGKYQGQILFMPYKYQKNKQEEYLRVCEKMNKKIAEAARE